MLLCLSTKTACELFRVCILSLFKLCLTLCDSLDCIPPGSSVHGIFQARILEWVAMPFSWSGRGSSLNPYLLHWQMDSLPRHRLGSPVGVFPGLLIFAPCAPMPHPSPQCALSPCRIWGLVAPQKSHHFSIILKAVLSLSLSQIPQRRVNKTKWVGTRRCIPVTTFWLSAKSSTSKNLLSFLDCVSPPRSWT